MAALMLGGIALGFIPFFIASHQVKALCESLLTGSTPGEVKSLAQVSGYEVSTDTDGRMLIKVPALASRVDSQRGCQLRFGPQGLVSARFGAAM